MTQIAPSFSPGPEPPEPFPDVPLLLESSQPRPRANWVWYAGGLFLLLVLGGALASRQSEELRAAVDIFSALLMVGLVAGLAMATVMTVRRHRAEQQQVEAAGELVQLRRWPQAAFLLGQYLSKPSRTHALRAQALIFLASVLGRYHRFADAVTVQEHLLEHDFVDPSTGYGLRLGRAMAMLRDDRLVDADRAMSELRRVAGADESAGMALVEMYRDVKTGHAAEAAEIFEQRLPAMRAALGHRSADAYALAARAYDLLGRGQEARDAYAKATLLSPPAELHRRYPEVEKLAGRYEPSPGPGESVVISP